MTKRDVFHSVLIQLLINGMNVETAIMYAQKAVEAWEKY